MPGTNLIPQEIIEKKIYFIRGKKVMLDRDLAELYGVSTKVLNQSVKRNIQRFPQKYMFQLTKDELEDWKSQIVTSNKDRMGLRRCPYAFTELGVSMLSSILNSERAIKINMQIMETFVRLKDMIASNIELKLMIEKLEDKFKLQEITNEKVQQQIGVIFEYIQQLIAIEGKPKKRIGFNVNNG